MKPYHKVLPFLKRNSTGVWVVVTLVVSLGGGAVGAMYADRWALELTQIFLLAVTAIALFFYAQDTKIMASHSATQARAALESTYRPLAQLVLRQGWMPAHQIICPFTLRVLRRVPFLAKIDVRLTVGGQPVTLGNPLYDGEEEWCIYGSFGNLPCSVGDAIVHALPPGYTLEQYVIGDSRLPPELSNRADRIAVTPLMIYRSADSETKVTSAARSYLDVVRGLDGQIQCGPDGQALFTWMPDVQRSRYPEMVWSKSPLSDYMLEELTL